MRKTLFLVTLALATSSIVSFLWPSPKRRPRGHRQASSPGVCARVPVALSPTRRG